MSGAYVVFMGTSPFAISSLRALKDAGFKISLVVTTPDRPKGRGLKVSSPAVKEEARKLGLPLVQPESIKEQEFIEMIRRISPDFIVVAAYGKILPPQLLSIPKKAPVNVHASLLPKYRGPAPIQWAIINGEKITGVTTMIMDEGVDTGPILLQRETEILPEENAEELERRLSVVGGELLIETLNGLLSGTIKPRAQDHENASYARFIKKEDGRIEWDMDAEAIHNRIRGLQPWPGAYTNLADKTLKIYRSKIVDRESSSILPGTVIEACKEGLKIATGKGIISILEIQREGKRRLPIFEFLKGFPIEPGTILGR